jgi:hypothetical protein
VGQYLIRPLIPLDLEEFVEVTVAVHDRNGAVGEQPELTQAELAQQQAALNAMFAEVDHLPQTSRNDGLSNRDRDQILYSS